MTFRHPKKCMSFFKKRMYLRYIQPIELIKNIKINNGEGFSVVALICTTIEALASCRVGLVYKKNYNELTAGNTSKFYSKSGKIFKEFLTDNEPFKNYFDQDLSADFYTNVRCALLHEAAVKNNWLIRSNTSSLILRQGSIKILNRNILLESLKEYLQIYEKDFFASNLIKINLNP